MACSKVHRCSSATGDPFSGLTPGAAVGSVDSLTLLPPVHPGKIVAVGLNYVDHVKEGGRDRDVPDEPVIFMKPQSALIGNGETIQLPMDTENIHYEAELAVVIGKRARRVSEADAYDYVLGLTCGNDVSARILQAKDGQWTRAKGFDTFLPLGPAVNVGLACRRSRRPVPPQWRGAPERAHVADDLQRAEVDRLHLPRDDARSRRCDYHRHPGGRRPDEARRHD